MSPVRTPSGSDAPVGRAGAGAAALLLVLAASSPLSAAAPAPAPPGTTADTLVLEGRVVLGPDSTALPGRTVVLHRVDADSGAAVDTTRSGPEGEFTFRIDPADQVVHLATTRYDGVLYFGPAVHGGRVPTEYPLTVWRASEGTPADSVRIRSRTLVLTSSGSGLRVMDVVDAAGRPDRTLAGPAESSGPWWGVRLPDAARDVRVLPGGVDREAVQIGGGEARVAAAIPPRGLRLVLGYRLPEGRPLRIVPGRRTERVEVVARGLAGRVAVSGLRAAGGSAPEDGAVRRWVSAGTVPDTVSVTVAGRGGGPPWGAWIAAAAGVVLLLAAVVAHRTVGGSRPSRPPGRG